MTRTRIAEGIYRDKYGYAVIWRDRGRAREKRFAPDTPIATLKAFRKLPALKIPKTRPKGVPGGDTLIATVAARLAHQERIGRLRDGKTRARFLVLATCGKRPCQLMRTDPADVDFATRIWDVVPAKNSDGGPLYLNDEMLAAWTAIAQAAAWGPYDSRSFSKTLQRNGWPKGVRPYRLRHQTLQTMSKKGVELGDIQQAAGHDSPDTTRRHYVPHELARSKAASETIDQRFAAVTDEAGNPVDIFTPREPKKWDKPTVAAAMAQPPVGTVPS
jgi:integrase